MPSVYIGMKPSSSESHMASINVSHSLTLSLVGFTICSSQSKKPAREDDSSCLENPAIHATHHLDSFVKAKPPFLGASVPPGWVPQCRGHGQELNSCFCSFNEGVML